MSTTDNNAPTPEVEKMAEEIACDLFTRGDGEKAERLVMERGGKTGMAGWCKSAVRDRIAAILARAFAENNDAMLNSMDVQILAARARAEKAEAENESRGRALKAADDILHGMAGETGPGFPTARKAAELLAERDELRAQLAASEARHADAQMAIRNGLDREDALKAQLAAAQEDKP